MSDVMEVVPLRSSILFSSLTDEQREEIVEGCYHFSYDKSQQIVRAHEKDDNIYFIDTGAVRVSLYSNNGKEVNFIKLSAGENFGELSAIDQSPRSATVIALCPTDITIMPSVTFKKVVAKHPDVAFELMRQLTAMIRRLCERIFEYTTLDVINRIHCELIRLSKEHLDQSGVARITNPPSHIEFAGRISCNRESVSRELTRLEQSGLIIRESKVWTVPNYLLLQEAVRRGCNSLNLKSQIVNYRPVLIDQKEVGSFAAVALIARLVNNEMEILFIKRATHSGDPWSGQIAFPGGRQELYDVDLLATACRETNEEISLPISCDQCIGRLDDQRGSSRNKFMDLGIACFVIEISDHPHMCANYEVADIFWVSKNVLSDQSNCISYHTPYRTEPYPAIVLGEDRILWGLTYRFVQNFIALIP